MVKTDTNCKTYTSVKIPKILSEKITKILDKNGYRSVSEFIMEAIREHLKGINNV